MMTTIFGYVVAGLMFILGTLILLGFLLQEETPAQLRLMVGVVMILFGIVRTLLIITERRRRLREAGSQHD